MILGLTGGMGCGKSTVARLFEESGFRRLDSDEIIRTRVLADPSVVAAVSQNFGPGVLDDEGRINRGALAAMIFTDDPAREWLEGLLHPKLFAIWREEFGDSSEGSWVVEVPLLFEKRLQNWFDFTLCVTTTPANQLSRLEKRGITRAQAEPRISKQLSLARKIEFADFVISNDGAPAFLRRQVATLVETFTSHA